MPTNVTVNKITFPLKDTDNNTSIWNDDGTIKDGEPFMVHVAGRWTSGGTRTYYTVNATQYKYCKFYVTGWRGGTYRTRLITGHQSWQTTGNGVSPINDVTVITSPGNLYNSLYPPSFNGSDSTRSSTGPRINGGNYQMRFYTYASGTYPIFVKMILYFA